MALLEADVALPVVKDFVESVKQRALGQEVMKSLSPGQVFLKIVQSELENVMGTANEALNLASQPPAIVLVAGLQGAGKTTSVAKLARDLMTYDVQPSSVVGIRGEFLSAPRLDNLASCHAAVTALLSAAAGPRPTFTRAIALYDHEEVGSRSAAGAAGSFLADVLERAVAGFEGGAPQGLARALARNGA